MTLQDRSIDVEQVQVVEVQLHFDSIARLPSGIDLATTDQRLLLACFEIHIRFAAKVFDPGHDDPGRSLCRLE